MGHIQRVCRSAQAKGAEKDKRYHTDKRNIQKIDEASDNDSDDALASLELFSLGEKDKQAIWLACYSRI